MLPLLCSLRCWRRCGRFCWNSSEMLRRFTRKASRRVPLSNTHAARVAQFLVCRPSEIVFTSGGTESDNLAVFGSVRAGDHVITSAVEHHAVLHAVERLGERGVDVEFLPVDGQGVLAAEDVRKALGQIPSLISVMMANNETGVLQPVEEIGRIAGEAGIRFHVDAVQAAGKIPIHVDSIGCQLLSISGHKMHGPQGTGALFVRRGTRLEPLSAGGAHERQRRAGTENVAGIVGLGDAAECAMRSGAPQSACAAYGIGWRQGC